MDSIAISAPKLPVPKPSASKQQSSTERIVLLLLLLLAFLCRIWALDSKGLAYDEAATALMARATPGEIIRFHWNAAFEHPPFWQLLMHVWSLLAGQSEFALRLVSVFAGVTVAPLVYQLAKRLLAADARLRLIGVLLVTFAPALIYYSQEARMYAIVVALAVASLYSAWRLATRPGTGNMLALMLINWAMLGFHYYSALLLMAVALFLLFMAIQRRNCSLWGWSAAAIFGAGAPLLFWVILAPGFRATADAVLAGVGGPQPSIQQFLGELWRDLTFAAIRWQTPESRLGYLLLPLVGLGLVFATRRQGDRETRGQGDRETRRQGDKETGRQGDEGTGRQGDRETGRQGDRETGRQGDKETRRQGEGYGVWLLTAAWLLPIVVSALISRSLASRYLLYVAPIFYLFVAVAIRRLGGRHWVLGGLVLALALTPAAAGLVHYFGSYQKSEYREMARYLNANLGQQDAVLIEAPRQHLLAKYYFPPTVTLFTAPQVTLPDYWPINALPVVPEEMDDLIQRYLRDYRRLWLVLSAENEVDPGEFIPKYLKAVAIERECHAWLDVRLCQFLSPHALGPVDVARPLNALFANELLLQTGDVTLVDGQLDGNRYLAVTLHWQAITKPTLDYRVTLRLAGSAGDVIAQRDNFPIGPLLPPTTWNPGDEKPGYGALPIASTLPPGAYQVVVGLYDPNTLAPIPYLQTINVPSTTPLLLASVMIGDKIEVR